jgi:hypothetical protein
MLLWMTPHVVGKAKSRHQQRLAAAESETLIYAKYENKYNSKDSYPGTAPQDGCLLARRELSVSRPDLSL